MSQKEIILETSTVMKDVIWALQRPSPQGQTVYDTYLLHSSLGDCV